ncbi:hypothetical protein MMC19_007500 [Ptychographa xylographoides]|nr:hypothetical protein [Ptychographa xylographoides]
MIGHLVTVILQALTASSSYNIQIEAVQALNALIACIYDTKILRSFLPGILSGLTKTLQLKLNPRRPYMVLVGGLQTTTLLLRKTVSNGIDRNTLSTQQRLSALTRATDNCYDKAWVNATAGQIKLALANIAGIRYHERSEVLDALFQLCMAVLADCSDALQTSTTLMLETAVCICSHDPESDVTAKHLAAVRQLLASDDKFFNTLKTSSFDWIAALPRIIQSNHDTKRAVQIKQISASYNLIASLGGELSIIDNALASSLQESATAIISSVPKSRMEIVYGRENSTSLALDAIVPSGALVEFNPLAVTPSHSQNESLLEIHQLIEAIGFAPSTVTLKKQLIEILPYASGNEALACLWLSSKLLQDMLKEPAGIDQLVNYPDEMDDASREFMEVVYSHCIDLLSATAIGGDVKWRSQAIALEILAWQSQHDGVQFRSELIHALYPILERLGSSNFMLREHAMTCLNMVSRSCGYSRAGDLVIQNADYLVNAVAIKFNTFEMSPQAPRVLSMMVKICGPTLIPYLDDVVESVFSALANFHGYPRLTEGLIAFLRTIVEETIDSSGTANDRLGMTHRKMRSEPLSVANVAIHLHNRVPYAVSTQDIPLDPYLKRSPTLKVPGIGDVEESSFGDKDEDGGREHTKADSGTLIELPGSKSQIYSIVQSIVRLSQHYLTQESPKLRLWLLQLIATSCTTLARNESEFLPLVNDIWSVVIKRLYDPIPFVAIAAAETLSKMFQAAGDFMSSRIQSEWHDIRCLYKQNYAKVMVANKGRGGAGNFASANQIGEALVRMLVVLMQYVRVEAEMEDDLFEMLGPLIFSRMHVRETLELVNPDAMWLQLQMHK